MGATHAFVYLSQQFLSFFRADALQFHIIGPPSVQSVIDKLIHTGPKGYFFSFVLVTRKLSGLEEADNVPCQSWSLGLGNED